MVQNHDVLIVGGSHAGLSAAMALGRMRRKALVCDDGSPRNKISQHANNLISQDGMKPDLWREKARQDLTKYGTIHLLQTKVTRISRNANVFHVHFSSGLSQTFRKVILAYGVKDNLPSAAGFNELWGSSIFHCPFCHGYEFQDRALALVGNGKYVEHMLPMALTLTKNVQVFTNGKSEIEEKFLAMMAKHNVDYFQEKIIRLNHDGNNLKSLILEDGRSVLREAILLGPVSAVELKSDLSDQLGCERSEMGYIKMFEMGKTSVDGVLAAGDITSPMHSVANAVASGQLAGARAVMELVNEDFNGIQN